jgi:hypothetical protein
MITSDRAYVILVTEVGSESKRLCVEAHQELIADEKGKLDQAASGSR